MSITFSNTYKVKSLHGRYICLEDILPLMENLPSKLFELSVIGYSHQDRPIHYIRVGNGAKKVVIWSQMHGNETSTTRALFDIFQWLQKGSRQAKEILEHCTLHIIPMLNPDGAFYYTRLNANSKDLNRDAHLQTQKEIKVLCDLVKQIQPDFAFNLHEQRTIFSAGNTNKIATLSFLAPSENEQRDITPCRKKAMALIAEINKDLQNILPEQIGRYDDSFNINCTGDTFTVLGIPTLLFEVGHFAGDYTRELCRDFVGHAIKLGLYAIATSSISAEAYQPYFDIPQNGKCFNDIVIRQALLKVSDKETRVVDIALQFEEKLIARKLRFIPKVVAISDEVSNYGHLEIQANKRLISLEGSPDAITLNMVLPSCYLADELVVLQSDFL